jgi:putative addiction module killer protein
MVKASKPAEAWSYEDSEGKSPFGAWLARLPAVAAAKVTTAVVRLELGNRSEVKPVGEGVSEKRIDSGPGYRIYFAQDGDKLIILLGGGDKSTQKSDIKDAKACWKDYKARK